MSRGPLLIPSGSTKTFEIAGLAIQYRCELDRGVPLRLPETYASFSTRKPASVVVRVSSRERIEPSTRTPLKLAVHWTLFGSSTEAVFEFRHLPSSRVYCRAVLTPPEGTADVVFAEETWQAHGGSRVDVDGRALPFPLEQLLLLPVLASHDACMLHAGGGLFGEQAFIFAGHSGDGKTTLSGLLADEGVELLSDERVVLRKESGGFVAYGTPWSGQGNVASPAHRALSQIFVLRKSHRHFLTRPQLSLLPELVSRAIVPYYFRDSAGEILRLFAEMARAVPVRELHFARAPGVSELLRNEVSASDSLTMPVAGS